VRLFFCLFIYFSICPSASWAATNTDYYNHVIFDNSITPDYYYYSSGRAVFPSTVGLLSGALPVEKKNFFTAPNALRLEWRSVAGGSWETELRVVSMRNRLTDFRGDTLYIWCYSPETIPAADLPTLQLEDEEHDFTVPVKLEPASGDVPAKKWFQIRLPLSEFATASVHPFQARELHSLHFGQGNADDTPRTLIIDEVKIDDKSAASPVAAEVRSPPRPQLGSCGGRRQRSAKLCRLPLDWRTQVSTHRNSKCGHQSLYRFHRPLGGHSHIPGKSGRPLLSPVRIFRHRQRFHARTLR
jgi:hypothetical protein